MSAPAFLRVRALVEDSSVQRIRGFYFYNLGTILRQLRHLEAGRSLADAYYPLFAAKTEIDQLLGQSLMPLRSSRPYAQALSYAIDTINKKDEQYLLTISDIYEIIRALDGFEIAYNAENSVADTFVVTSKAGYDAAILTEMGEMLFPPDLAFKARDALEDARSAGRCLAFSLGTAAGFHLLRVLESVVLKYRKQVIPGSPDPKNRNLGGYIRDMEEAGVGTPKVLSALRQIKDLHRNPLLHPEESLSVDQAIDLFGIVRSVVSSMLNELT